MILHSHYFNYQKINAAHYSFNVIKLGSQSSDLDLCICSAKMHYFSISSLFGYITCAVIDLPLTKKSII